MPKVSVLIPTYNQARYVSEAIESALVQTYSDYEIVVVDDGSTDGTGAVAEAYIPRVRVIHQENRGESGARNAGLQATSGEYIAFLDGDDVYLPDKLERQVNVLGTHQEVGVAYSDVYLWDTTAGQSQALRLFPGQGAPSGNVLERLVRGNLLTIHAALVRRECLETVGFFDETIHTFPDWELWLRLAANYEFFYLPGPVARYRLHPGMVSRNRQKMWQGALTVRRKLLNGPLLTYVSAETRQFNRYQCGLLSCLVGDIDQGRTLLLQSYREEPPIRAAILVYAASLLGRRALQMLVTLRSMTGDRLVGGASCFLPEYVK